jgi:hypothetical protein
MNCPEPNPDPMVVDKIPSMKLIFPGDKSGTGEVAVEEIDM